MCKSGYITYNRNFGNFVQYTTSIVILGGQETRESISSRIVIGHMSLLTSRIPQFSNSHVLLYCTFHVMSSILHIIIINNIYTRLYRQESRVHTYVVCFIVTSCHIMSHHVISCHIMSYHVVSCRVVPHIIHIISWVNWGPHLPR